MLMFLIANYHSLPYQSGIDLTTQAVAIPLDHGAGRFNLFLMLFGYITEAKYILIVTSHFKQKQGDQTIL
jgi:hypothetical protein